MDVVTGGPFSLGELGRITGGERAVNEALGRRVTPAKWVTASLPAVLEELARVRNPAAHGGRVGREEAGRVRDWRVGVGCVGELVELARLRVG